MVEKSLMLLKAKLNFWALFKCTLFYNLIVPAFLLGILRFRSLWIMSNCNVWNFTHDKSNMNVRSQNLLFDTIFLIDPITADHFRF